MTQKGKKSKPLPMMERVMKRLQEGVALADVAAEVGINEMMLASFLEAELAERAAKEPPAQKPTLARRKPVFLKDGRRLGKAALWS